MNHKNLGSLARVDYEDTFSQACDFKPHLREVLNRMFYGAPFWIRTLLKLRNQCVQLLGLKVDEPSAFNAQQLKSGDRLGLLRLSRSMITSLFFAAMTSTSILGRSSV